MSVAAPRTLADVVVPSRAAHTLLTDGLLVLGASCFVAACARVAIPLPFTPVPVTGQTFGVLLTGILLGRRRGAFALALYLMEGVMNLPVFAGGVGGSGRLFGPTGGYLWSYPLAALLVGWLAERGWDRRPAGAAAAMGIGSVLILLMGSVWLSYFVGGLGNGIAKGMLPFLPGDAIKLAAAAALLPTAWSLTRPKCKD